MNFESLIEPLMAKLRLMVGRCVISASRYKNGELLADIELVAGERRRNVEFLQQFGFSSRPKGDVEGVALFIGGSRDNGVVIATRGECPDLKEGEVQVHSPFGSSITLKNDGSIELATNSNKFRFVGDIEATGEVKAMCDSTFVTLTNHIHPTGVGPSSKPTPGQ
ncbi:MAG: phage baseplate assembly protein [Fibrobacter sp.]|nr:phage baseplate assembly protein [Fibrobacter sp.]